MKKFFFFLTMLTVLLLPFFASAEEPTLQLDSSSILSTISQVVSSNWATIIGIAGILIGVTVVLRLVRKAAGR